MLSPDSLIVVSAEPSDLARDADPVAGRTRLLSPDTAALGSSCGRRSPGYYEPRP